MNAEKSKIIMFKRGRGRLSKRWKGKKIEEVKEFAYLGYTLQRNGGQEVQVRDRVKRTAAVMRDREEEVRERLGEKVMAL